MTDAEIFIAAPPPRLRPLKPGETGAELAGYLGLHRCPDCGEFRGTCNSDEGEVQLLCICEGIVCRACTNLIRKPISYHFDESDGRIWHTPYFVGIFPCAQCREESR